MRPAMRLEDHQSETERAGEGKDLFEKYGLENLYGERQIRDGKALGGKKNRRN